MASSFQFGIPDSAKHGRLLPCFSNLKQTSPVHRMSLKFSSVEGWAVPTKDGYFGGWNAPKFVVAANEGRTLFYLGLAVVASYVPLYYWRVWRDRAAGGGHDGGVDVRGEAVMASPDSTVADVGAP